MSGVTGVWMCDRIIVTTILQSRDVSPGKSENGSAKYYTWL